MKILFFIPFFFLTLLLACDKEGYADNLPAITTEGANTFGCMVNDNILIPKDGKGTFNAEDKGMVYWSSPIVGNYVEIDVQDFKSKMGNIIIHIVDMTSLETGTYLINESNGKKGIDALSNFSVFLRTFDEKSKRFKIYCSTKSSGELQILKYDKLSKIISGTFEVTLKNKDDNETIEIKEGRFDINWKTLSLKNF